jgi:hypothetical protein
LSGDHPYFATQVTALEELPEITMPIIVLDFEFTSPESDIPDMTEYVT